MEVIRYYSLLPAGKTCHYIILVMAVFSQALNISLQDGDLTSLNNNSAFSPHDTGTPSQKQFYCSHCIYVLLSHFNDSLLVMFWTEHF